MTNLTCLSYAKINLHLQVLGRRSDGYHDLETIFQTVDLSDELDFELTGPGVELEVARGDVPSGETNLAYRAASEFLGRWAPGLGVRMWLRKRIPVGGGLGGGSSNAATVLRALVRLTSVDPGAADLHSVAASIGADVPFFLHGGTALGLGRGDLILEMPDIEDREIWLVTPPVSISTARVFRDVDSNQTLQPVNRIFGDNPDRVDWQSLAEGCNDLEKSVFVRYPEVVAVYNALVDSGAAVVRLSGSGATLFAIFGDDAECPVQPGTLPPGSTIVATRTLTRERFLKLDVDRRRGE